MQSKIFNKLLNNDLLQVMNELLDEFILSDYSEKDIYKEMKFMNESIRMGLYLLSLSKDLLYLAKRIENVNKRINRERKEKFIAAFKKGDAIKFLVTLGKGDKLSLLRDLGIDLSLEQRKKLSKVKLAYYQIISDSIKNSQLNDYKEGLESLLRFKINRKEA